MNSDEIVSKILGRIDRIELARLKLAYPEAVQSKFFDVVSYVESAVETALGMGLSDGRRRRILDIGCGFGYFCLACDVLGHSATGIEPKSDFIRAVANAVSFNLFEYTVEAQKPIASIGRGYDLISIYGVNFNQPNGWWTWEDYRYLIDDLYRRLNIGGSIWLRHNNGAETDFIGLINWPYQFTRVNNLAVITRAE